MISSFLAAAAGPSASGKELEWWTAHALTKVRPFDAKPALASQRVEIRAARNEFEPFQIVLKSKDAQISGVDLEPSGFVATNGSAISKNYITVYLERFIGVKVPSSLEGAEGEWPDALVPRVDRYYGERRNSFPFTLKPGRNQPIWIDVYVPLGTPAGTYRGSVRIKAAGIAEILVPVTLTVWDFELPSTSSMRTAFGFSGPAALKQHRGKYTSDEELYQITHVYAKAALLHRISIYGASMAPPPFRRHQGRIEAEWKTYDSEVGPFLDGTVLKESDPLPGARATSVDLRTHNGLGTDEDKVLYWKDWIRHFREKGWLDRLYHYVWDEPSPDDYAKVAERARITRRAGREIKNLVTASVHPGFRDSIDIWVPLVNCFDPKPGFPDYCVQPLKRDELEAERVGGKSIWWYQSCSSHGCNITGGEYFRSWPSYVIDCQAISNRIMQWLAWNYRIAGELYYSMNEAYSRSEDPWDDLHLYGGNGDGTLFYPGAPERIGGSKDIPVESIRLKLIREGMEDYEFLFLLSKRYSGASADARLTKVVTKSYRWSGDPESLYAVRQSIGDLLSAAARCENTRNSNPDAGKLRHASNL